MRCAPLVPVGCWLGLVARLNAFVVDPTSARRRSTVAIKPWGWPLALSSSSPSTELLDEIRSMRVAEIKKELVERKISIQDVFEKEELVQRLVLARRDGSPSTPKSTAASTTPTTSSTVISTPLILTSMDTGRRVADAMNEGGIIVEPSQQPYATMQITVQQPDPKSSNNQMSNFTLSLLLDTACSGFVLRPEVQTKYKLPSFSNPVRMTGAAGTSQATGLTQLVRFSVMGDDESTTTFGPLPAAVQDIGGLPSSLDGIIGQSFLSQFTAFELDFRQRRILFYKDAASLPNRANETLLADAPMRLLGSLGIYTANVYIGKGCDRPVVMLVDTGAACTLLNWKGVADLGLQRDSSPQLSRIPIPTGAMGSDNVAIQLSHRLYVSSTIGIGDARSLPGVSLQGASRRLPIDVGNIPVLDGLPGVGGILGADFLMRCDIVRISCREPLKLTLYQSKETATGI